MAHSLRQWSWPRKYEGLHWRFLRMVTQDSLQQRNLHLHNAKIDYTSSRKSHLLVGYEVEEEIRLIPNVAYTFIMLYESYLVRKLTFSEFVKSPSFLYKHEKSTERGSSTSTGRQQQSTKCAKQQQPTSTKQQTSTSAKQQTSTSTKQTTNAEQKS
ncbi:17467_t:CDS:2 [Dentiscutata heterogama]|uniref:17467_t:CDS:1 n=1 Tax=Dentiscutata heterogama TaxID=1316150 RepID=A0ACA9KHA2_9GLOM|nr:17467_t:CDS:2 [Dentiscutata heterogama]